MSKKTYKVAYLALEGGRPVLKIGELLFDQKGKPAIVWRDLGGGSKLTMPIPDAAIPRLQKVSVSLDYIFPDGILPPPEPKQTDAEKN